MVYYWRVLLWCGGWTYDGIGRATIPLNILENSISPPLSRLICKGSRLSSWNKRVTVPGYLSQQFLQKWAALRCTASVLLIWCFWCGDHTELAYSKCGRTRVLYAWTFTRSEHRLRFLLTKPNDLLALTITFSTCLFQLRLIVNSTPIGVGLTKVIRTSRGTDDFPMLQVSSCCWFRIGCWIGFYFLVWLSIPYTYRG